VGVPCADTTTEDIKDDDDRSESSEEYIEEDEFSRDSNLQYRESSWFFAVLLTSKVSIVTPLLAVSKKTNAEVMKVLTTTRRPLLRYYEELLSSSIHLHRIRSPSAALIDLWSSSELILQNYDGGSLYFLKNLPDSLKSCVRRLVITRTLLAADDDAAHIMWSKDKSRGGTLFTNWISDNLPNLRTVAIQIPNMFEEMDWNWNPASDYLCDMLQEGRLDTVRFFYKDYYNNNFKLAPKETDSSFFRRVTLEGSTDDGDGWFEEFDRSLLNGVEEPISPTSLTSQLWRDLGAYRVVKITRSQPLLP